MWEYYMHEFALHRQRSIHSKYDESRITFSKTCRNKVMNNMTSNCELNIWTTENKTQTSSDIFQNRHMIPFRIVCYWKMFKNFRNQKKRWKNQRFFMPIDYCCPYFLNKIQCHIFVRHRILRSTDSTPHVKKTLYII